MVLVVVHIVKPLPLKGASRTFNHLVSFAWTRVQIPQPFMHQHRSFLSLPPIEILLEADEGAAYSIRSAQLGKGIRQSVVVFEFE